MGGSSEKKTTATSSTTPYGAAQGSIDTILGKLGGQIGNAGINSIEKGAFDTLTANANAGNPYAGAIGDLATGLLSGGGAKDQAGNIQSAYDQYKGILTPFATGANTGPGGNPALKGYLDTISNDVSSRVNGMFAGAGRDLSGANLNSLARGIAEGTAPVLAAQYNTDIQNQLGAASSLYGAGNTTAGLLSGLNQQDLANKQAGIDASASALAARDSAANQLLSIESAKRQLPIQNYGGLLNLIAPIGQAFATTNQQQTTTQKEDPTRAIIGAGIAGLGLLTGNPMAALGGFGGLGLGGFGSSSGAGAFNPTKLGALY